MAEARGRAGAWGGGSGQGSSVGDFSISDGGGWRQRRSETAGVGAYGGGGSVEMGLVRAAAEAACGGDGELGLARVAAEAAGAGEGGGCDGELWAASCVGEKPAGGGGATSSSGVAACAGKKAAAGGGADVELRATDRAWKKGVARFPNARPIVGEAITN